MSSLMQWPFSLVTPESLSISGPSKSRTTSPTSSFLKTLQILMLGP
eukprot:CAMPEP_0114686934 /NCGR_PEP_ID=MMETSP0191-20121206/61991_1 /TAXON_ID=126664 /ORGANISM="Sorites sp." /LENGTH=45 /DNA_ID= /DNA_START= /DNA_END= /DNA_ORIENTATION=